MRAITLWICLCAYLDCAGWILSALHELNAGGYAVALAAGAAGAWWWLKHAGHAPRCNGRKLRRRFGRGFPLAFLVLAGLALLGGVLYAPSNYDALTYRTPRVLHWLAAGQWHWIDSIFPRVNRRCCGMEWISAPIIALGHSLRPLFLINFVSFLFLPGLMFSVFTRLGVRPRVAWHWMWLAPAGYCYLLQAGGIGNDLFGAVFVLAAMDFALRARATRQWLDLFPAVLAAALMTSAKPSNLPLLLPLTLVLLPTVGLIRRWPARIALLGLVALTASFAPNAILNQHYCHDWTGMKDEIGPPSQPFFLTGVNTVLLGLNNFNPPVCPFSGWWNAFYARHLPAALAAHLANTMEGGAHTFNLPAMQMEESSGLGCGISLLVVFSLLAIWIARPGIAGRRTPLWLLAVRWSPVVSVLVIMSRSWFSAIGREITPYYAILLPLVLVQSGHGWLVAQPWWRRTAALMLVLAAIPLVLSPPRPLFPAMTICNHIKAVPQWVKTIYTVYHYRPDAFAPVKAALPKENTGVLGFVGYDDTEASLWLPLGSRRIEDITPGDSPAELKSRGIHYVLIRSELTEGSFGPFATWLQQHDAQIVQTNQLQLKVSKGAADWLLVKLN